MKKNEFDNRLQNDLFPQMPRSFERKLQEAMENEGVKAKKRPTATGVFAGAVSVVAVAAVLLIVLVGVMGGGRSKTNAAAQGETADTPEMAQSTPGPGEWKGDTQVITLSSGFDFTNVEKLQAMYTSILSLLKEQGESEPDELWLCAIRSRFVKEDTGYREDGYLNGYYVLAQHAFGENDGPELYCLSEDFEVLWCTEGSVPGPNHVVAPREEDDGAAYQSHFIYGMVPVYAHVTRGALVGTEPGTDIEFSVAASINEVQQRLTGSQHADLAREYFLVTVSADNWDSVMENPILRFETMEGPVDVNMKNDLPKATVALGNRSTFSPVPTSEPSIPPEPTTTPEAPDPVPTLDANSTPKPTETEVVDPTPTVDPNRVKGVEYWLSQNQPLITDLTAEWDDKEAVEIYGQAVARALRVSGEDISAQGIWVLGVDRDGEDPGAAWPKNAYVLALNVGDGEPSPELFYYKNGRILWMTQGASDERINVVHHQGNTIVFGKSPAFDNRPLAMTYGKVVLQDGGSDSLFPILSLEEIQQRITGGPYYYSARECFLWMNGEEQEVKTVTVAAMTDGQEREFVLDRVNVLEPQKIPAMAVESGGVVYPGRVTHMAHSLDEDGVAADGTPIEDTMANGLLFKTTYAWQRPLTVLTASDAVSVDAVDVYLANDGSSAIQATGQLDGADLGLADMDSLPPGTYYLCFRTTVLGPYSEKSGRYAYRTDYTIYKVAFREEARLSVTSGEETVEARHIYFVADPDGDGTVHYLKVSMAQEALPKLPVTEEHLTVEVSPEHDLTVENVIAFNEWMKPVLEGKDAEILHELPKGNYSVCFYARRKPSGEPLNKSSMGDVEVFACGVTIE